MRTICFLDWAERFDSEELDVAASALPCPRTAAAAPIPPAIDLNINDLRSVELSSSFICKFHLTRLGESGCAPEAVTFRLVFCDVAVSV